jgi:branched-chain amino acid transport system substrate-binding protein
MGLRSIWTSLAVACLLTTGPGAIALAAETKGPVTDPIGVVRVPKGQPLVLGSYWILSGADAALGLDQKRAVEIAIADLGGTLLGHPIELVTEDSQCNADGGQAAATKLAANKQIVLVLGPSCSSEATPGAPILWKAGIPSVGTSPSAPSLTDPKRPEGFRGLVRVIYNDKWQGAADAKWAYEVAGHRTAAMIHDGTPYGIELTAVFAEHFRKLGGRITSEETVAPTGTDMRPVLTRIATGRPAMIYYPIFIAAAAHVTQQAQGVSGLEKSMLVGSSALLDANFLTAAGDAAVGLRFTSPDISPDAFSKGYPAFVKKYRDRFGEAPIQGYHAFAYDAAVIALKAITKVAKRDAQGNTYIGRNALRDVLFATRAHPGLTGTLTCDPHGDCGVFKPAVYQYTNADPKTFRVGTNPIKIWPK